MAKLAIRRSHESDLIRFSVIIGAHTHQLKLHIGPGDDVAPVLTLMLPTED
jgi:hypothetical protein